VAIRLEDSPSAVEDVEEGRADLAIAIDDNLPPGLKVHTLFKDELMLFFSPLHEWTEKTRLSTADLKKQHYLLYQRNSVTFRRVEEFFLQSGVRLNSYVEIPSFEIMKQLARLGLGVAVMAPWFARKELAEGSLVALPTPRAKITRHWVVAHQGTREIRQAEQTFIGLCRLATTELGRGLNME
jgi:DNA-binding transcriptional LysR family regulator